MGTKGKEIVKLDVEELISLLNKALADEWLAYYQYWIGSKIVTGPMKKAVAAELIEHAQEELLHADMLAERILQLGGTPVLEPKKWYDITNCGYEVPADPSVIALLKQNIKGEQCAIAVYERIVEMTKGKDHLTYHIALEILKDEVEHEDDLESLLQDLS